MSKEIKEQWRTIKQYPDYSISNLGRVRSDRFSRYLKPQLNGWGYERVAFPDKEISYGTKALFVHKLVYEHFIGEIQEGNVIDHIDKNKVNNRVDNLRQISWAENIRNSYHHKYIDGKRVRTEPLDNLLFAIEAEFDSEDKNLISSICNFIKDNFYLYRITKSLNKILINDS